MLLANEVHATRAFICDQAAAGNNVADAPIANRKIVIAELTVIFLMTRRCISQNPLTGRGEGTLKTRLPRRWEVS
jgi:hypothetical protein